MKGIMETNLITQRMVRLWKDTAEGLGRDMTCLNEEDALRIATRISTKSPCRSKRGAVIWNHRLSPEFIQVGWNDQPFGFVCDGSVECKSGCGRTAIHAEESAILAAERGQHLHGASILHVKTVDCGPVASGPPSCIRCSGMIVEAGLDFVWLLHDTGLRRYTAYEFHVETIMTLAKRGVVSMACMRSDGWLECINQSQHRKDVALSGTRQTE